MTLLLPKKLEYTLDALLVVPLLGLHLRLWQEYHLPCFVVVALGFLK